jgi:Bacterial Ig-like domain (group 3)
MRRLGLAGLACAVSLTCPVVGPLAAQPAAAAAWATQPVPVPDTLGGTLAGVSCAAIDDCTAVGYYVTGRFHAQRNPTATLAEHWNGHAWALSPTQNPQGATYTQLSAVTCTSATACVTVGAYFSVAAGSGGPLAEWWNGSDWSMQLLPQPAGASTTPLGTSLDAVSCTSSSACTAVGSFRDAAGNYLSLAERWDGTGWAIQPTQNVAGANFDSLNGVACTSPSECIATGNSEDEGVSVSSDPLVESWNGSAWTLLHASDPPGTFAVLNGVSCPSASSCTAVGSNVERASLPTLAESWSGTSWSLQSTPNPAGAASSSLVAVSCPALGDCTAVGSYDARNGPSPLTLAEHWSGTRWTIEATPPAGSRSDQLSDVSCDGDGCEAVGGYVDGAVLGAPLAEGYLGAAPSSTSTGDGRSATGTRLALDSHRSVTGQRMALRAIVRPVPAGGTVRFAVGGRAIGGCRAVPVRAAGGTATCRTSFATAGRRRLRAVYSGDVAFAASKSAAFALTVRSSLSVRGRPSLRPSRAVLRLACAARSGGCHVSAQLTVLAGGGSHSARRHGHGRRLTIGARTLRLRAGRVRTVVIELDRAGRRLLRSARGTRVRLSVALRSGGRRRVVLVTRLRATGI